MPLMTLILCCQSKTTLQFFDSLHFKPATSSISIYQKIAFKEEQFDFQALIRLGENVFHSVGEGMDSNYPKDEEFWMSYDAILADTDVLDELNATVTSSLKSFVQKKKEAGCYFWSNRRSSQHSGWSGSGKSGREGWY